ncbi:MAG: hypothetical protein ACJARL_003583 [Halopseudomonas sp.]
MQRAPTAAVIDLIQHAHDLSRRRRLHLSEQVIGELTLLTQIQQQRNWGQMNIGTCFSPREPSETFCIIYSLVRFRRSAILAP